MLFGLKAPLMQQEDGATGGGAGRAATTRTIPLTAPEGRGAQMTKRAVTPTEAEETKETERVIPAGTSTVEETRGQITGPEEGLPGDIPGAPKPTAGPFTAKGTITAPLPPDLQRIKAQSERRIFEAEKVQMLQDMATSGVTEQEMRLWAAINERDAAEGKRLYQDHFLRAKQNIASLREKVDAARSLRINPYNWHESIGRGGRVAAAFAALTGGFAAGQNNPNSALKMMDAAIERDIAAQKQNIQNVYENLKLQRGLNADEAALFAEQMNALNEIRAVNYAAIMGRIQAAKQRSITEAHRLAYETAEDHYALKLVEAFAAAQKEYLRIEVNQNFRSAAQAQALQQQMAQIQQQLAGRQVSAQPVTSAPGATQGRALEAPRTGSAALRRGGPPRVAGQGTVAAQTAAEAAPAGIPEGAVAQDEQGNFLDAQGNIIPMTAAPADQATTVQPKFEKPSTAPRPFRGREEPGPEEASLYQAVNQEAVRSGYAPPHIAKYGSYAAAVFASKNAGAHPPGVTNWGEAIADLNANREIRNGGMASTQDARVVAAMAPMPDPSQYDGGEASAAYKLAKSIVERGEKFPEIYERPLSYDGVRNTITAGGNRYLVKAGSRDPDTYERLTEEVRKKESLTSSLYDMAELVRTKGLSGLFTDEGFQIPGITGTDSGSLKLYESAVTQAMNYIKKHDPTARISDQDLRVGLEAAVPFTGRVDKLIDIIQSLDGDPQGNTKRKQIQRFLAKLAVETSRMLWENIENDVVPDLATQQQRAERARKIDEFVYEGGRNP